VTGLQVAFFVIAAAIVGVYAILDGFDLGIGLLYLVMGRNSAQRAGLHDAIGPVWDGNEVWLIVIGGLLFAVFPSVYAAVLSGFYLIFMLIFFGLILRAGALGLHYAGAQGSRAWAAAFSGGSLLAGFLLGLVAGNLIRGVHMAPGGEVLGGGASLLNPFAVLIGLAAVAMFANQGACWAALKIQGDAHRRAGRTRWITGWVLLGLFGAATLYGVLGVGDHARALTARPLGWAAVAFVLGGLACQQIAAGKRHDRTAFLGASASVLGLVGIWTVGTFPVIVRALNDNNMSLTVANSAAPHGSLVAMVVVAAIGVPLVAACAILVYRVFRGRSEKAGEGY
jgi:cytochrome d ubiquinol oxidase subunit II